MNPSRPPLTPKLTGGRFGLALLALVLMGAALRARALPGPFGFGWQHVGAHYALMARNFVELGWSETRGAQITNAERVEPSARVYYTHHPPGMGMTAAVSSGLFGDTAFAIRLPTYLFGVLQIALTGLLLSAASSPLAGLVGAAATAFLPAGALFGTNVNELGSPVVCLSLLVLWLDLRARRQFPESPPVGRVAVALLAALFFDWPALLIAGCIVLRDLYERRWRRAATVTSTAALALVSHVVHARIATRGVPGRGGSLVESFLEHGIVGVRELARHLGGARLVAQLGTHWATLFTGLGALLIVAASAALGWRWRRLSESTRWVAAVTLVFGVGYSAPFLRGILTHEFWMLVFLPYASTVLGIWAETSRSRGRTTVLVAVAVACSMGVVSTWVRQDRDRTPYFEELGAAIESATHTGVPVLTSAKASAPLLYYSRRQVHGNFHDADPRALAFLRGNRRTLPRSGFFCLVTPSVDPPDQDTDALAEFLRRHFESDEIGLPRSGTNLSVFDFSKPRSPESTSPNPAERDQ